MRLISLNKHDNWKQSKYRPYKDFDKRVEATKQGARRRSVILARSATKAERNLQNGILKHKLMYDFQKPIRSAFYFCVADFYFPRGRNLPLIVEVDGDYHKHPEQRSKDNKRTEFIRANTGATILRFSNDEVMNDLENVMQKILTHNPIVMSPPAA